MVLLSHYYPLVNYGGGILVELRQWSFLVEIQLLELLDDHKDE